MLVTSREALASTGDVDVFCLLSLSACYKNKEEDKKRDACGNDEEYRKVGCYNL